MSLLTPLLDETNKVNYSDQITGPGEGPTKYQCTAPCPPYLVILDNHPQTNNNNNNNSSSQTSLT